MNAVTPAIVAGRGQGVLAYVDDDDSEAVLRRVAARLALPAFDLKRGDIRLAEQQLQAMRSPGLLFVDLGNIDRALEAVQALSDVCEPQLQVVVIGRANDVGLFRHLLGLGVADYLFKPLTADLVETVLWRLTNGPRENDGRLGKVVAITGASGGAGASSLAAALATYLAAKAARRVALVDLDTLHGPQALMLGVRANAGLAEALENPGRIDDLFLERAKIEVAPRLDLLASELPQGRAPAVSDAAAEALLGRLQRSYHYVLLDVPRSLGAAARSLAAGAQTRILATTGTLVAARDAAVQMAAAPPAQRLLLVHNQAARPGDLPDAELGAALGRMPDAVVPFLPRAFGTAQNFGTPAWREDPRAEAAVALLAREMSGQAVKTAPAPAWRQAWDRLRERVA